MKVSNNLSNNYSRSNRLAIKQGAPKIANSNVSFGAINPKAGVVNLMNFIERHGFFAEFLILDFISLIAPRIAVGLERDRDKTGKWNIKAGSEEARRELFSGPSIFIIPALIMQGFKSYNPATFIPKENLARMTEIFKSVVSDKTAPETIKNTEELTKTYAGALFDDAFKEFKLPNREELRSEFIKRIMAQDKKPEGFINKVKAFCGFIESHANNSFEELVKEINNKNNVTPLNPESLRIEGQTAAAARVKAKAAVEAATDAAAKTKAEAEAGYKGITLSAQNLYKDFHNFVKDIVPTAAKDFKANGTEGLKKAFGDFIDTVKTNRKWTRISASVLSFLAVGSFLLYLPKLYKVSNVSPAMDSAKRAQCAAEDGGENENI